VSDIYQILADDYLSSNGNIGELLRQKKFENDPFISVLNSLLTIFEIVENKEKVRKIFALAESYDALQFNPLAKLIFYHCWGVASVNKGYKKQAEIIFQKAKRIDHKNEYPYLIGSLELMVVYVSLGKLKYAEKLILEYDKHKNKSPQYNQLLDKYLTIICSQGIGDSKSQSILEKYKNEITPKSDYFIFKFVNDLANYNCDLIQNYITELDQKNPVLTLWLATYHLLSKKEYPAEIRKDLFAYSGSYTQILRSNFYLMNSNLAMATNELSQINKSTIELSSIHFLRYTNIRVELSNKNLDAAFQLLKQKINGDQHYLDDFFLARVELLKGNKEKAFQFFWNAYQASEDYSALNRLNLELDLSLELKPSDVFFLTKNMDKKTVQKLPKINYDELLISENRTGLNRLIGTSNSIKKLKEDILTYSTANLPVLITGETGVGKEVVAKALHEESPRKAEPFIAINCGAIADTLLQSEIFGHTAGAYTGAIKDHKGVFVEAGKGTVFLDEIGEISPSLQVAFLRILENYEVRPVGGSSQINFQCRIIAATNADLLELVKKKLFREDLYYRLKRLEILIPPLRERVEDIIPLVNHYLKTFRHSNEAPILSANFQTALCAYTWPGNIRQLKNEIEKMDLIKSRKSYYELSDCEFLLEIQKEVKNPTASENKNEMPVGNHDLTNTHWRRLEKIRKLFTEEKDLTRKDIARLMNISLPTATSDLKKLVDEKYIIKVELNASPRSHYFILNK